MHIGGLNFNKNLQEIKSDTMNEGILKEINKNTSAEHFKVSKKHKFGHGAKKPEGNVLCGELNCFNSHADILFNYFPFVALFESIESNQAEKLKTILEKDGGELHVNTLNNDGFSPLDVAVLLENHAMIKILLLHGGNAGIEASGSVENHLKALITDSDQKLHQLSSTSTTSTSSAQNGMILDVDKQKSFYDQRIKLLKKMIVGWQNLRIPNSPFSFSVGELKH